MSYGAITLELPASELLDTVVSEPDAPVAALPDEPEPAPDVAFPVLVLPCDDDDGTTAPPSGESSGGSHAEARQASRVVAMTPAVPNVGD